jgi:hypothetical protein
MPGSTAAQQVLDRRAVAVAHDGERVSVREDVLGGAVSHQSDADVADAARRLTGDGRSGQPKRLAKLPRVLRAYVAATAAAQARRG